MKTFCLLTVLALHASISQAGQFPSNFDRLLEDSERAEISLYPQGFGSEGEPCTFRAEEITNNDQRLLQLSVDSEIFGNATKTISYGVDDRRLQLEEVYGTDGSKGRRYIFDNQKVFLF